MSDGKSRNTHAIGSLLEKAISIAASGHVGQRDKNGQPYILHPLRVMARFSTDDERIVAVLHDIVEDTPWTIVTLRQEGFAEELLTAIECLTRRKDENYEEFVQRCSRNPLALRVKLADLEDNLDVRRLPSVTEKDVNRLNRYLQAWRLLIKEKQNAGEHLSESGSLPNK